MRLLKLNLFKYETSWSVSSHSGRNYQKHTLSLDIKVTNLLLFRGHTVFLIIKIFISWRVSGYLSAVLEYLSTTELSMISITLVGGTPAIMLKSRQPTIPENIWILEDGRRRLTCILFDFSLAQGSNRVTMLLYVLSNIPVNFSIVIIYYGNIIQLCLPTFRQILSSGSKNKELHNRKTNIWIFYLHQSFAQSCRHRRILFSFHNCFKIYSVIYLCDYTWPNCFGRMTVQVKVQDMVLFGISTNYSLISRD